MLILVNEAWPWLVVGILLLWWGAINLKLNALEWIKMCIGLVFNIFSDHTKKEKRELEDLPIEDALTGNVGYMMVLFGVVSLMFGVITWLSR